MFPEQIRAGLRPWSPLKMYARVPIFPISDKGMFDSATGKYHPVRFYDFIHEDVVGRAAQHKSGNSGRKWRSGAGRDLHANRAGRLVAAKIAK